MLIDMVNISLTTSTSEVVHRQMRARKMTQMQLAKELGISQPSVSLKLAGKVSWEVNDLRRLSALFNVSIDELLSNSEMAPAQVAA